ncbi:hypothetical protein ACFL6Y_10360 [Elusimicrobiota bacterium]
MMTQTLGHTDAKALRIQRNVLYLLLALFLPLYLFALVPFVYGEEDIEAQVETVQDTQDTKIETLKPVETLEDLPQTMQQDTGPEDIVPDDIDFKQTKRIFTPYYQFEFSEGMSVPSKGDFFANHMVDTKIGGQWRVSDRTALFGLYNLSYEGPGLIRSEGRLFSERAIKHSFLIQPSIKLEPIGNIKAKVFSIVEKRRSGTNEVWGEGLYDYKALGIALTLDRKLLGLMFSPFIGYTDMDFPNYTDLLREFETSGLTAEIAGGLMDQRIITAGFSIGKGKTRIGAGLTIQDYQKEKVVGSGGTYENENQKDSTLDINANTELVFLSRFLLFPRFSQSYNRSNQNYLRFAYFGDPAPAFVEKNYDYDETSLGGTLLFSLTRKPTKFLYTSSDWNWRKYSRREPRDAEGVYAKSEHQKTLWATTSFGYRWKSTAYTTWTLAYSFIFSSSNMKYESFIPYNYTGHMIGMYFSVTP